MLSKVTLNWQVTAFVFVFDFGFYQVISLIIMSQKNHKFLGLLFEGVLLMNVFVFA